MYTIPLKDSSKEIDIVVIRSLLALAGITSFFYRTDSHAFINIAAMIILLTGAFTVRYLISFFHLKKIILLTSAALLLFAATHSISFSLLLIIFGMLSSFIYKKPFVLLDKDAVVIKSSKGNYSYDWGVFENIVLKDSLLTLDFKNNKLLQLDTGFNDNSVNQNSINTFCADCLKSANSIKTN